MGGKESAKFMLMKRKNLEKFWQSLSAQKYHLEEQLINITEIETQSVLYDALSLAE